MILLLFSLVNTVTVFLVGVSATAAIGVGSFDADFSISGVVASANVGAPQINVETGLTGVAATPNIGTGTVNTGGEEIVNLVGVAANPQIGNGTVQIQPLRIHHAAFGEPIRRAKPKRDVLVFLDSDVWVPVRAGKGSIAIDRRVSLIAPDFVYAVIDGDSMIDVTLTGEHIPVAIVAVGQGTTRIVTELLPEEIMALIES